VREIPPVIVDAVAFDLMHRRGGAPNRIRRNVGASIDGVALSRTTLAARSAGQAILIDGVKEGPERRPRLCAIPSLHHETVGGV
jgi:hypothetical protein